MISRRKKFIVAFTIVSLLMAPAPVMAAGSPDRVTLFNKITDYFATLGKTEADKQQIIRERKEARRKERVWKERQRHNKKIKKKIQKQNQAIMEKIKTKKRPYGREGSY